MSHLAKHWQERVDKLLTHVGLLGSKSYILTDDDGSVSIEWISDKWRFLIVLDNKPEDSSWAALSISNTPMYAKQGSLDTLYLHEELQKLAVSTRRS